MSDPSYEATRSNSISSSSIPPPPPPVLEPLSSDDLDFSLANSNNLQSLSPSTPVQVFTLQHHELYANKRNNRTASIDEEKTFQPPPPPSSSTETELSPIENKYDNNTNNTNNDKKDDFKMLTNKNGTFKVYDKVATINVGNTVKSNNDTVNPNNTMNPHLKLGFSLKVTDPFHDNQVDILKDLAKTCKYDILLVCRYQGKCINASSYDLTTITVRGFTAKVYSKIIERGQDYGEETVTTIRVDWNTPGKLILKKKEDALYEMGTEKQLELLRDIIHLMADTAVAQLPAKDSFISGKTPEQYRKEQENNNIPSTITLQNGQELSVTHVPSGTMNRLKANSASTYLGSVKSTNNRSPSPSIPRPISSDVGTSDSSPVVVTEFALSQHGRVVLPHIILMVVILAGMSLLAVVAFWDPTPSDQFDKLRQGLVWVFQEQYALQIIFYIACGLHFVQALYVFYACRKRRIVSHLNKFLWFFTVCLFGYPSLRLLLKIKPLNPNINAIIPDV